MSFNITPEMIVPGITRIASYYTGKAYTVEAVEPDTENGIAVFSGGPLVPAVKLTLRIEGAMVSGRMTERIPATAVLQLAA